MKGKCQHYWLIEKVEGHDIGHCKLCHEERDFTELQQRDKGWGYTFETPVKPAHGVSKPIGTALGRVLFTRK